MARPRTIFTSVALLFARSKLALAEPYATHTLHSDRAAHQDPPLPLILDPVHPSVFNGAEGRNSQPHNSPGNYIMQGLQGTMNLVDQQYGLRDSESFYWGIDGNPIANLTAYTDEKAVRVLSLERFENVLQTAECSPSSVKLTFTKEVQFDAVQTAWQWVNDDEQNYIVLITDTSRCNIADGDETVRQPWHVKSAAFEDDTNVVTLGAEPKKWADAFSNWRLNIRSQGLLPQIPISKRLELKRNPVINLDHDFSGINMAITATTEQGAQGQATINCTECKTYGSLDFDIDIVPYLFPAHLQGHAAVSSNAVGTILQVKTTVKGAGNVFEKTEKLLDFQLPIGAIGIPEVLDLAPHLKFSVAGKITAAAEMSIESGVFVNITDNSTYRVDFDAEGPHAHSYGWIPGISPSMEPAVEGAVSLTGSVGGLLQLDYEGQALGIDASVGIELAAPTLTLKASTFANDSACGVPGAELGMNFEIDLGMSFNAYEELNVGGVKDLKAAQTIWSTTTTLYETCTAIGATENTPTPSTPAPSLSGAPYMPPNGTVTSQAPYPTTVYARRAIRL